VRKKILSPFKNSTFHSHREGVFKNPMILAIAFKEFKIEEVEV
jgi:hypothetical protein